MDAGESARNRKATSGHAGRGRGRRRCGCSRRRGSSCGCAPAPGPILLLGSAPSSDPVLLSQSGQRRSNRKETQNAHSGILQVALPILSAARRPQVAWGEARLSQSRTANPDLLAKKIGALLERKSKAAPDHFPNREVIFLAEIPSLPSRVMRGLFKHSLQNRKHRQILWARGGLLALDNVSQCCDDDASAANVPFRRPAPQSVKRRNTVDGVHEIQLQPVDIADNAP